MHKESFTPIIQELRNGQNPTLPGNDSTRSKQDKSLDAALETIGMKILNYLEKQQDTLQSIHYTLQRIELDVIELKKEILAGSCPPVNDSLRRHGDAIYNGNNSGGNSVFGGCGGINYDRLSVQALTDINQSISTIGSLIKDIYVSANVKQE